MRYPFPIKLFWEIRFLFIFFADDSFFFRSCYYPYISGLHKKSSTTIFFLFYQSSKRKYQTRNGDFHQKIWVTHYPTAFQMYSYNVPFFSFIFSSPLFFVWMTRWSWCISYCHPTFTPCLYWDELTTYTHKHITLFVSVLFSSF